MHIVSSENRDAQNFSMIVGMVYYKEMHREMPRSVY